MRGWRRLAAANSASEERSSAMAMLPDTGDRDCESNAVMLDQWSERD